jgi:Na+-transporting methylmalonyl-CoA/oxaloacetate decarboxylase gamma subunit
MEIVSLTIVGVSVVFLCFVFLYVLLKVFEKIFAKQNKTLSEIKAAVTPTAVLTETQTGAEDGISEEEIAAISAAIFAFSEKPFRISDIRLIQPEEQKNRGTRKYKTWRVQQKGDN